MTDEEYQQQKNEEASIMSRIQSLTGEIHKSKLEQEMLKEELGYITKEIYVLIDNAKDMTKDVNEEMTRLARITVGADNSVTEISEALNAITSSYFIFKNISTASKNLSQYTDEYYTKFSYYNELRRITLGYVIGLDAHICSSEIMRKKVEKAYLENTEYWLAYCIAATMLWASDEKEEAQRAIRKSLSINEYNACLYYLLVNLRFKRIEAARKWFMSYLARVNMNEFGAEWQYLLQAYLQGSFGNDKEFQTQVSKCFFNMMEKVQWNYADYSKKVVDKAKNFADTYLHSTEVEYLVLKNTCSEYAQLKQMLSSAEKNSVIARYYNEISDNQAREGEIYNLQQRIEDVLYSLINDYDSDELKVIKNLKYNEAVIKAKGDVVAAEAKFKASFHEVKKNTLFGDLLINWAFEDKASQVDRVVRQFSISYLKKWIITGFEQYAEAYRKKEKEGYSITIDNCTLVCGENDFMGAKRVLESFYAKNKYKELIKDKFIGIYSGCCIVSLLIFIIMTLEFSKIALVVAVLLGLVGSFLLWRRVVDVKKILDEKKKRGINTLKQALCELGQWRSMYKEEDIRSVDLKAALERF